MCGRLIRPDSGGRENRDFECACRHGREFERLFRQDDRMADRVRLAHAARFGRFRRFLILFAVMMTAALRGGLIVMMMTVRAGLVAMIMMMRARAGSLRLDMRSVRVHRAHIHDRRMSERDEHDRPGNKERQDCAREAFHRRSMAFTVHKSRFAIGRIVRGRQEVRILSDAVRFCRRMRSHVRRSAPHGRVEFLPRPC